MHTKHTFRLSALAAALALGASAPVFAQSNDASFADSMAVGGATSTTYQRAAKPAPAIEQPVAAADVTDSTAVADAAASSTAPAATGVTSTTDMRSSMASAGSTANTTATSTDSGSSEAAVYAEAPMPVVVETVAVIVTDDSTTRASAADLTEPPAAPAPVKALEPQIITREQVRDELRIARQSGTLSHTGELADTPDVLVARDNFNAAQTDAIVAEYRAEYDRQVALVEAERQRAQIAAEAAEIATLAAMVPSDDQAATQVRVEVLDMSGE